MSAEAKQRPRTSGGGGRARTPTSAQGSRPTLGARSRSFGGSLNADDAFDKRRSVKPVDRLRSRTLVDPSAAAAADGGGGGGGAGRNRPRTAGPAGGIGGGGGVSAGGRGRMSPGGALGGGSRSKGRTESLESFRSSSNASKAASQATSATVEAAGNAASDKGAVHCTRDRHRECAQLQKTVVQLSKAGLDVV